MTFRIKKKRIGDQKIKRRKEAPTQSNEQAKRQELAEWDAIAESAKRLRGEPRLESPDEDD